MRSTPRFIPFLIGLTALAVLSCVTPRPEKPAPCVPSTQTDLVLRWGTEHDSLGTVEQYTMNTKGEIFSFSGKISERNEGSFTFAVDQGKYCLVVKDVSDCFLRTQALNVRGKRARYVEYRNTATDVYLRAVWNPDLETFQSRDMRELFSQLMALLPRD